MIDLLKMEEKFQQVFDEETPESLLAWYFEKQVKDYHKLVGRGSFDVLESFANEERAFKSICVEVNYTILENDFSIGSDEFDNIDNAA